MPLYRICFCANRDDPWPPARDMHIVYADSAPEAVMSLLRSRRWPKEELRAWAKVVSNSEPGAIAFPLQIAGHNVDQRRRR